MKHSTGDSINTEVMHFCIKIEKFASLTFYCFILNTYMYK